MADNKIVNKIDVTLLKKKTPTQPTAEYLEQEFINYVEYANERQSPITKHGWRVFLNVLDQTMTNWMKATRAVTGLSEEEYNRRLFIIKKIDTIIEENLSESLLNSERTNGNLIFYLKNSYKWTDRPQQEDVSVSVKSAGFLSNKKRDKK